MRDQTIHSNRVSCTAAPNHLLPSNLTDDRLEQIQQCHHRKRGPRSNLHFSQLFRALVYHVAMSNGSLQQHVEESTGVRRSASALSERRQALPWAIFQEILDEGLICRADPQ